MKNISTSYFGAALIMLLGLVYNIVEQDFFGSGIFLTSSIVFLCIGLLKRRNATKAANLG